MKKQAWIALIAVVVVVAGVLVIRQKGTTETEIRFGASFPLTGQVASYGIKAQRGIEMAVSEVNEGGGLLGQNVVVEFQDDVNDPKQAVSILTRFATVSRVPVVFGSAGSSCTLAMAPIANRNRVLLVSPISSSAMLTKEGGPFFFRTVPADDLQAKLLAGWVHSAGKRRVAVIFTNNSWGKPLADGFTERFIELGGEVVASEGVAEETTDFRTILTRIRSIRDIDAIVSPTYPKEGGILVRQAREMDVPLALYGGDNWGSPEFRTIADAAAEGVFYTAPAVSVSPEFSGFAERYRARYGEDPDVFGGYAFDAANAVFAAVRATDGDLSTDRLRDALRSVTFMGVSGEIAFDENGDRITEGFDRKTIRNGVVETVK
jgi:branched-chain amino acid transport system substrate-binding protein